VRKTTDFLTLSACFGDVTKWIGTSAHSEFYFCEALWPDFRKVDFLRALRSFTQRERRYGR
jgi:undecaprenyl diphosphate synthase